MDAGKLLHGFQLDDAVLYDQVCPKSLLKAHSLEFDGNGLLALDLQTSLLQLMSQDNLVDGLQQTQPKCGVDMKGCIHNRT